MTNNENNDQERLVRLENEVAELKQMLSKLISEKQQHQSAKEIIPVVKQAPPAMPPLPPAPVKQAVRPERTQSQPFPQVEIKQVQPVKQATPAFELPEHMRTSEYWLNKIGIGLMLFAVVFLFKYSVDQGWLTASVRVGMGLLLGLVFYAIGFKIYKKRQHFALVLLGGGTATFYITGFAAFQMFELVPHMTALIYMTIITAITLMISVRQNEQILSMIGTIGGLATPFLLYTGVGNMPGLMMYTSLITAGAVAIYFFKSWRSLLWLSVFGNWMIMVSSVGMIIQQSNNFQLSDYWGVQYGLIASFLFFWMVPLLRELMGVKKPDKFFYAPFGYLKKLFTPDMEETVKNHAYALSVSTPLITLLLSGVLWDNSVTNEFWGYIYMGSAMLFGLTAYYVKSYEKLKGLAYAHLMVGLMLLTISFALLFEENTLLFTFATEALVLYLIARKVKLKGLSISSHILFVIVSGWVFLQSQIDIFPTNETPLFNTDALIMLWAIAAVLTVSFLTQSKIVKRVYLIVGFGLLASLLSHEFEGNLLSVILSIEAAVLHYLAYRIDDKIIRSAGHIFIAVIGMWLVDRLLITRLMEFPITRFERPIFNLITLSDLVYMIALFFLPFMFKNKEDKNIYRIWLHVIVLAVLLRDFQGLENGQGYVTIAWGIYAAILMILGLRKNHRMIRTVALATLFLVVAKLFLVDLKNLETIWRILLFFGFGGAFMFLSYYFKALWKKDRQMPDSEPDKDKTVVE